jgi:hypothetical protein
MKLEKKTLQEEGGGGEVRCNTVAEEDACVRLGDNDTSTCCSHCHRGMLTGGAAAKVVSPNHDGILCLHLAWLHVSAVLKVTMGFGISLVPQICLICLHRAWIHISAVFLVM